MAYDVVQIPEVAGEISTEYAFWTGYRFTVGGERVKPRGLLRNRMSLPGAAGPVEVTVKGGMLRAYPSLVVDGTEYRTGPATPRGLQIVAMLPLLAFLLVQGAVGVIVVLLAVAVNMAIVRSRGSSVLKVVLMLAVLVVALVVDVAAVLAVNSVIAGR